MTWTTDKKILLMVLILLANGCSSTARVIPEDESARELLRGRDCVTTILASSKTASVERAKLSGRPIENPNGPSSTISKIHHMEFTDEDLWFGRQRCVDVVGE